MIFTNAPIPRFSYLLRRTTSLSNRKLPGCYIYRTLPPFSAPSLSTVFCPPIRRYHPTNFPSRTLLRTAATLARGVVEPSRNPRERLRILSPPSTGERVIFGSNDILGSELYLRRVRAGERGPYRARRGGTHYHLPFSTLNRAERE